MKKALLSLLALVFCATGLFPLLTKADGIFIPPIDYYVSSTAQKAVIIYEKGTETMVISTQFRGDAKNFGWVIPVPARPEVAKSADELFTSLNELTAPKYDYPVPMVQPLMQEKGAGAGESVQVLETKKVGVYEIKILEASDAQALAKWLEENKYMYPKEGSYILDEYIRNRWYFVAAKIDTTALEALSFTEALKQGHAQPIKIAFKSDKLVYPMKISSLQAALAKKEEQKTNEKDTTSYYYPSNSSEITFYVFAENKKELPGFTTQYAGYVSPKTIKKLAYVEGESWWQPTKHFYLTRLYDTMTFSEMTEDLIFRQADDNRPVNGEKGSTSKVLNVILYSFFTILGWVAILIGLTFIIFSFVRHYAKSKATHTLSAVIQWIGFALTATIFLVTLLVYAADGFFSKILEFKDQDIPALGMLIGGLIIVVVCLLVLLKQQATYRKIKEGIK